MTGHSRKAQGSSTLLMDIPLPTPALCKLSVHLAGFFRLGIFPGWVTPRPQGSNTKKERIGYKFLSTPVEPLGPFHSSQVPVASRELSHGALEASSVPHTSTWGGLAIFQLRCPHTLWESHLCLCDKADPGRQQWPLSSLCLCHPHRWPELSSWIPSIWELNH